MDAERLLVVDDQDRHIGYGTKRECHMIASDTDSPSTLPPLHRAFSMFYFSSGGRKLLIAQRSANKLLFPEMWSNACCSHPLVSDMVDTEVPEFKNRPSQHSGILPTSQSIVTAKRAARRKMLDELGVEVPCDSMTFVGRYQYSAASPDAEPSPSCQWLENEVDYAIISSANATVTPNKEEVMDFKWVSRDELALHMAGNAYTPWFRLFIKRHLFKWWSALEEGTLRETDLTTTPVELLEGS